MAQYRGRFAPSATGPLHLGSILAALVSYIHAKHHHGDWLIRIDDLDKKRCNQIHVDSILDCLDAFGFSPSGSVCRQTDRILDYQNALSSLEEQGRLYPCSCTRKLLPKGPYPGFCRNQIGQTLIADRAVRIDASDIDLTVDDLIATSSISQPSGDFIVKRRDGLFAYQLACAVDERIDGITHVIRGIDLLDSTPMQRFITKCLGYESPIYGHFPILVGADGTKLSKQTFAEPVDWTRPGETFALISRLLLLNDTPGPNEHAQVWLDYFVSLDNLIPLIVKASEANTLSI